MQIRVDDAIPTAPTSEAVERQHYTVAVTNRNGQFEARAESSRIGMSATLPFIPLAEQYNTSLLPTMLAETTTTTDRTLLTCHAILHNGLTNKKHFKIRNKRSSASDQTFPPPCQHFIST